MAGKTSSQTTADRLGPDERRATILAAGWELLLEAGPQAVKIDAVVARVGVTRPIFYRHFRDRTDLIAAMYADYADDMSARTMAVAAQGLPLPELLRALFSAYLDCVADRGPAVRALVSHAAELPELEVARARLSLRQVDLVDAAMAAAGASASPAEVRLLVRLLNAIAVEGATAWLAHEADRPTIEAMAGRLIDGGIAAAVKPRKGGRRA